VDTFASLQKQIRMLDLILHFHRRAKRIIEQGALIVAIQDLPVLNDLIRMKTRVPNDQVEKLDDIHQQIDEQMDQLEQEYK
jgi:V/A-type H+-transporting ATPase subunit A